MYRHVLVPLDDSDLTVDVVSHAVALARPLGARLTFFHAVADQTRSLRGDAELLRVADSKAYEYLYLGKAGELLAKAEAAARALSVPSNTISRSSDKLAPAIVELAREEGCDLIVMGSHGRKTRLGMAFTSETLAVVMESGIPVLVLTAVGRGADARAIGIIRDEHRSLAAVIHGWIRLLASARASGADPDPNLMASIVRYIQEFPVRLHHPKEEEHLFRALRERAPDLVAELDELERQHGTDREYVRELSERVAALAMESGTGRSEHTRLLEERVNAYARFMWDHMGREESVILPAARRHLTAADWDAANHAFAESRDPRSDANADREFRQLFSRIANLTS